MSNNVKEAIARLDKEVEEKKEKLGYTVMGVASGDNSPTFAYTVGMDKDGFELIVVGFSPNIIVNLINSITMTDGIQAWDIGIHQSELFRINDEPVRYEVRKVNIEQEVTPVNFARYRGEENVETFFELRQVIIGDPDNLLPGEEGYGKKYQQEPLILV